MEDSILNFVNFLGHLDFNFVVRIFLALYGVFWFFIVVWVWFDASDKSDKLLFRIFSVLLTLGLNLVGLIIYFLIRPADSYDERYWQKLEKKYLELETGGLSTCKSCDFELEPSFANCPNCGLDLKDKCEECGMYVEKTWKFCGYCGTQREPSKVLKFKSEKKEKTNEFEFVQKLLRKSVGFLNRIFKKVGRLSRKITDKSKESLKKLNAEKLTQEKSVKKSKTKSNKK